MRGRTVLRAAALAAGLLGTAALLISQGSGGRATNAAPATTVPSDDPLFKAMRDEMDRSQQLRVVSGQDAPYFFSYSLTDADTFHVIASMGSTIAAEGSSYGAPSVEVRVGSYDFDNTDHVFSGRSSGSRYDGGWPLDENYANFRDQLWLSTDRAFKTALESVSRKRASLNNAAAGTQPLPDFSKVPPVVSIAKVAKVKIDQPAWTARMARLSGVFNNYPEVLTSSVELQLIQGVTSMMNSEGTAIRYNDGVYYLFGKAQGQAPDGMVLHDGLTMQSEELNQFPSEAEVRTALTQIADNVKALVKAPAGEEYTGPVLFEPEAAAQLFAQLLGDHLRVPRRPLADPGRPPNFTPSELESKIGSRVLPDIFDVTDDPTQTTWNGKPLIGSYPFDLEGVAPKPVSVVEKGILKGFLTTRQPIKGFPTSNGHARLPGSYGAHSGGIGNLFVKARETAPLAELKKRMMDAVKERGKPYGILIKKLDFPYPASINELQQLATANAQAGGSQRVISPPILIYRVYPDGREELVRGMRFHGVTPRSLRDVLAASTETTLFEYINNATLMAPMAGGGYLAPASVIAPGLLFDEIEFDTPHDQLPKTPTVPPPSLSAAR